MPLKLNNSNDSYFTNVFLLNNSTSDWEEVRDLINAQGGGGGGGVVSSATLPLSISNGVLAIDLTAYSSTSQINNMLTNYITSTALSNTLSGYTDTTNLNTLLAAKQNTLTSGNGITISNNTISCTVSPLIVQLDGVAQNATTINFLQNNALLSGGVLNVSRLTHYDKIPLIYSTSSTIKDLEQDANGNLVWNSDVLTTTTSLNTALGTKQNTLTAGAGIFLNGSTITSYGLRWLTNNTPSASIQDLHFKSGFLFRKH